MSLRQYVGSASLEDYLAGEHVIFGAGEMLFDSRNDGAYVYEIVSGIVKSFTLNENGGDVIHVLYGPGNIFPLTWLINKQMPDMRISALGEVEVVRYKKADFADNLVKNGQMSLSVTTKIIMQLNMYAATVDNLVYRFASQRVAYRLLFIGYRFGKKMPGGAIVLPSFTNEDIGRSINLSRESVNRTVAKFIRRNLVEIKRNRIYIIDQVGLRAEVSKRKEPLFIDDFVHRQD